MDFDAGLLIFLFIFFVLPLIQRVLGKAKQAPPGSRPGQRGPGVPPGQAEGRARLPEGPRAGTADRPDADEPARAPAERAADLIPDDLWEILTGERRSTSSQRQREPDPEAEPHEWGTDAEEVWQPEESAARLPEADDEEAYREPDPLEPSWRREHEETAWTTTTTRTPAPAAASESVSKPVTTDPSAYAIPNAVAARRTRAPSDAPEARRRRMSPSLSSRSDLKRAFVLREVLGPPKALE